MNFNKENELLDEDDLEFIEIDISENFNFTKTSVYPVFNCDKFTVNNFLNIPSLLRDTPQTIPSDKTMTLPLTPYPNECDCLNKTDINKNNHPNFENFEDLKDNKSELHSYNRGSVNHENLILNDLINPLDVLRSLGVNEDDKSISNNIDKIFSNLEATSKNIFITLKEYKIPYPISKVLVKKIIKQTLDLSKGIKGR